MKLDFAFPDIYLTSVAKRIFEPVGRRESVFCRWFPGHGKTITLNQLLSEPKFLEAGFGEIYPKLVIVRIDGANFAVDPLHLFFLYVQKALVDQLVSLNLTPKNPDSIFTQTARPLPFTIQEIKQACENANSQGFDVLFVIDTGSQPSEKVRELYAAWARIVEGNLDHIHTHINSETRDMLEKGILPAVLIQSIVSVPLPARVHCDSFVSHYLTSWHMKVTKRSVNSIYEICGLDTWLIKEALRIMRQGKKDTELTGDPTLFLKAKLQYEMYSQKEKEVIETNLRTGKISRASQAIAEDLEKVNFWDSRHRIPRIIEQVIIQQDAGGELSLNPKKSALTLGSLDLTQKLTPLEHAILLKLFEKTSKVVSRDQIAEVMWGNDYSEKYSNWAIDKTMSRLRSRLSQYTGIYRIATRKGQGFVLET